MDDIMKQDDKGAVTAQAVDGAENETEALRADLMRLAAHVENLRKDIAEERRAAEVYGIERVVRALAPALDAFRIARSHIAQDEIAKGIEKIYDEIVRALASLGVVCIETGGQYDPKFHEAVERVAGERYRIIEEVGSGWMWREGEKVIVPAKVKVGAGE